MIRLLTVLISLLLVGQAFAAEVGPRPIGGTVTVREEAVGVEYAIHRISAEGYQWYRKTITIPDHTGAGGSQDVSFNITLGTHFLLVGAFVRELNGNYYPIPNVNPAGLNYCVNIVMPASRAYASIVYGGSFDGQGGQMTIEYTKL